MDDGAASSARAISSMVANWPLRNARTRSKKQIAQIVQSIPAFGFTNPILADPELPAVMIT